MSPLRTIALSELGLELPAVVAPLAAYVPAVRTGNLVFTAGQLPMVDGKLPQAGKVGADGQARSRPRSWHGRARSTAWPPSTRSSGWSRWSESSRWSATSPQHPDFSGQPGVINGASELLGEVFGEAGAHARSAVGVSELPLDAPVEVELVVEVE